jgi:3-hydroxy acid dehydrogenase/malonic semialdehyde reductase
MLDFVLGAPNQFPNLSIPDIITMSNTNVNGFMVSAYAVLNAGGMMRRKQGTILNVTSTTGP